MHDVVNAKHTQTCIDFEFLSPWDEITGRQHDWADDGLKRKIRCYCYVVDCSW